MKALKIALPVILVLLIGLGAFLYFFAGIDLSSDYYLKAGDKAMEAERYSRAIKCYTHCVDSVKDDPELVLKLADAYEQSGNYTKAEYTLVSGINEMPGESSLYIELSSVYVAQDKLRDAAVLIDGVQDAGVAQQLQQLRPAQPSISPESGVYDEFFTVSVSYPSGDLAYVSTDGDFPSTANPSIETEIVTTYGENTVYAVTVSPEGLVSTLASAEYKVANVIEDVTFADAAIEAQVRAALEVEDYVTLTTEDLWQISLLYIPGDTQTLEDLRWFSKLPAIQIENTAGLDLTQLSACAELKKLVVSNAGLTSTQLEEISALTSLTYLDISGNSLVDLSPIAELTGLTTLIAEDNSIFDISPLSGLVSMEKLDISGNSIDSIGSLWAMTGMKELDISDNPLTSITELSSMEALESLTMDGCGISDATALANKPELTYLSCCDNTITSLDGLETSTELATLLADNNSITDISFVSKLKKLEKLYLSHNAISAVPDLSEHTVLNDIDLSNNLITDISGIHDMELLNYLHLDYNQISDVSILASNYLLVQLDVFGNPVTETSMLTDMGIIVNKGVIENVTETTEETAEAVVEAEE